MSTAKPPAHSTRPQRPTWSFSTRRAKWFTPAWAESRTSRRRLERRCRGRREGGVGGKTQSVLRVSLVPRPASRSYFADSVRGGDRLSTTAANSVYAAGVSTLNGFVTYAIRPSGRITNSERLSSLFLASKAP